MIASMPRIHAFPERVKELLIVQHGLVTRQQLLGRCALHRHVVDSWLRRRRLLKVERGVYREASTVVPPRQGLLAPVLRCGPQARLGPADSLALHGIDGFATRIPPQVVIPVAAYMRVGAVDFEVARLEVPRSDRSTVDEIPCLSVARSLIELAPPALDEPAWRLAFDDGRRRRLCSPTQLGKRAGALGSQAVLDLLGDQAADPESAGERVMQAFLAPLRLRLQWQVADLVPGRRLDAALAVLRLGFEYDGRDHHVLPTDRDADGLRDLEADEAGVLVLRLTAGMIRDAPGRTLAHIERIVCNRAEQLGVPTADWRH